MQINTDPKFEEKLSNYPSLVKEKMRNLRSLVLETAQSCPEIKTLKETLKWGEPSFLSDKGSTLRMDWKEKTPDYYALYFQCTTKLVDTFRMVYPDTFRYEGTRAIYFQLNENLPIQELTECIKATLLYHNKKKVELLGIQ